MTAITVAFILLLAELVTVTLPPQAYVPAMLIGVIAFVLILEARRR